MGRHREKIARRELRKYDCLSKDNAWMDEQCGMLKWTKNILSSYPVVTPPPPPTGIVPVLLLDAYRAMSWAALFMRSGDSHTTVLQFSITTQRKIPSIPACSHTSPSNVELGCYPRTYSFSHQKIQTCEGICLSIYFVSMGF
jgi:hypothetical protein